MAPLIAFIARFFDSANGNPMYLAALALLAIAAGLGPVLIWLWVWEHEDKHPEPKKLVIYAFIGGALGVFVALPLESLASQIFLITPLLILVWAAIEEAIKYSAAYLTTLWRAENDEPIDGMMYMIIAALGFSAMENTFFIVTPLMNGNFHQAIALGINRFFGATIIHILASSAMGYALALGFHKPPAKQTFYAALGLCTAIVLHAGLNLSILYNVGGSEVASLYFIWIGVIGLVLLFERIKHLQKT